jgi:hypothetical protein
VRASASHPAAEREADQRAFLIVFRHMTSLVLKFIFNAVEALRNAFYSTCRG